MKELFVAVMFMFLSGCQPSIESELEGRWAGATTAGQEIIMIFKENSELNLQVSEDIGQGIYSVNGSSNPYDLDIDFGDRGKIATIIAINGNALTIENNGLGKARPLSFSSKATTLTKQ
ncbi:hypothetical protein L9G74_04580 [Shewanella sp. C32]|uniref:DUF5640 domain-containing protein n=1 Tax=Shewanella electrica TaxID=515560 RepID=A0ABT2FH86_9GAMM|nr:hypothetical protein [Shewanella electrica]MCH1923608.1 hypothetical protein [Shewanella electrica]MCS4555704.1 hypothetical protein [Shewanella electrica]